MSGAPLPAPFRLIARKRVGSTNDEAKALAETGQGADFLVVSAVEQTAGRGRRGRGWVSPPGNLHCSILLAAPRLDLAAQVGFVAAIAAVDALGPLVPDAAVRCKWPNDILGNGRKLAGMLLEPAGNGWLVLGLGIDVAAAPPDEQVMHPAVSLSSLGFAGSADEVLAAFCREFGPWMARWRAEGFSAVRRAWLERAAGLGGPITVRLEAGSEDGLFAGLDEDGALLLDQGGARRRIMAGDVFFPAAQR